MAFAIIAKVVIFMIPMFLLGPNVARRVFHSRLTIAILAIAALVALFAVFRATFDDADGRSTLLLVTPFIQVTFIASAYHAFVHFVGRTPADVVRSHNPGAEFLIDRIFFFFTMVLSFSPLILIGR